MSRSPYGSLAQRPASPGKGAAVRSSGPAPAAAAPSPPEGALSSTESIPTPKAVLRSSAGAPPRPPSSGIEPSPPSSSGTGERASKSPMTFRARRFTPTNSSGSNSGNDADAAASSGSTGSTAGTGTSLPAPGASGSPERVARRRPSENPTASSSPGALQPTGQPTAVSRSLSSSSGGASARPTTPAGNILASYTNGLPPTGGGVLDGGAGLASKPPPIRPKSREASSAAATSSSGGDASPSGSPSAAAGGKALPKARLSEEGGHAAGSPTLSLRDKVTTLQKTNKALEQQLAEAAQQAAEAAAAAKAAKELEAKLAELQAQLEAKDKAAAELAEKNKKLAAEKAKAAAELKAAKAAAAAAAKAAAAGTAPQPDKPAAAAKAGEKAASTAEKSPEKAGEKTPPPTKAAPPPLSRDKSLADIHTSTSAAAAGDGPLSPRTPLGWDGGASSSPSSSSSASSTTSAPSSSRRTSPSPDDVPSSSAAAESPASPTSSGPGRPHTAPRSDLGARSGGGAGDGSDPVMLTRSVSDLTSSTPGALDPDFPNRAPGSRVPPLGTKRASMSASGAVEDSAYLAGVGPPPMSPVAAAAGLSGAGVQLLAKQKKQIQTLRTQLQQKDSAYAFLANEHSELEGQLKEVEGAKREYAARYAFMVLDQDLDGHIRVDQVSSFDMFGCYAAPVLEYCFKHWRFASGFKGYLNMEDFVRFVNLSDDRSTRESQRFWFGVLDLDGDGCVSAEDAKWFYDAVEKDENAFVVSFEDLWHQLLDMTQPAKPRRGFTSNDLWKCKLGAGVVGLLLNHNNMLLHRTTAEWGRGDFPL